MYKVPTRLSGSTTAEIEDAARFLKLSQGGHDGQPGGPPGRQ